MSRFSERLERDLRHIADKATPSSTAWEAIQTRIEEQADHPEVEITMLEPNPKPDHRIRTLILSAAAMLLIVGGLYAALGGGDDSRLRIADTPTSTAAPATTTQSVADSVDTPTSTTAPTTTQPVTNVDRIEIEGSIDVAMADGELVVGSGTGIFDVTTGAEALGCASGTVEETYSFQTKVIKVMTCTSGARTGTFTIDAGGGLPGGAGPGSTWEILDATGDFVGLTGSGPYVGRDILQDEVHFPNPIYIFEPQSEYSDTMTGVIEFE